MTQVIDYSFARPSIPAIKAARYAGVCRYLSHDDSKSLSASERDALLAAGLDIILNFEDTAGNARNGYNAGTADGKFAAEKADGLGAPRGATIYFSVDYDTLGAYPTAVQQYLAGVKVGLAGRYDVGVYGSVYVVSGALAAGHARHGWMTLAWSHGHAPVGHLYQNGQQAFGAGADVNDVIQVPHGSWLQTSRGVVDDLSAAAEANIAEILSLVKRDNFGLDNGGPTPFGQRGEIVDRERAIHATVGALAGQVAALAAAVKGLAGGTGVDPAAIEAAANAGATAALQNLTLKAQP